MHRRWSLGAAATTLALAACQSPEAGSRAPAPSASLVSACPESAADSGALNKVVTAAQAFEATLSPALRAKLVVSFNQANAIKWSNYPAAIVPRLGVSYGELNPAQTAAAEKLALTAAGACGAELIDANRAADVIGHEAIAYIGPEHHYISFHGEPSARAAWMLMMGGHHNAFNFVFNGPQPGATPLFAGSDPAKFVDRQGREREPVKRQSEAMRAVARAAAGYPEAHLPGVFTDLVKSVVSLGVPPPVAQLNRKETPAEAFARAERTGIRRPDDPRGTDTQFPQTWPTTGRGVSFAKLSPPEQTAVRRAIESFAGLAGRRIAAPLLPVYEDPAALAQTYIASSGDPNLVQPNAYVRIDGPRLWIEMSVQASLNDPAVTHFHAVWRDKLADYGGEFRH